MRINKYLALNNFATRRGADELIKSGLVKINGRVAKLGDQVTEKDKVTLSHKAVRTDYLYLAYNKPIGIVSSLPQKGEIGITDKIKTKKKVFPVGRLDKDSRGLIILTNDGRITGKLLGPEHNREKEYIAKVDKPIADSFLAKMGRGVKIDKYITKPAKLKRIGRDKFSIILTEGKNRQIRRMCEAIGFRVIDLERVRIMNIKLGTLRPNAYRELGGPELKEFLKNLGL